MAVLPSTASTSSAPGHDIHVSWSFDAENLAGPLDLSTTLHVLVNGDEIVSPISYAIVVGQAPSVCPAGPSCGGSCGSYTLDGVSGLDLACFKDGNCSPGACDCDCGAWLTASIPGIALSAGDEITVRIDPSPSSASDDPSDNLRRFAFAGEMIGWNRGLSGFSARLSADGDSLYVRAASYVEFDGPAGALPPELNLDAVIEIYQGLQLLGRHLVVIPATHLGQVCPDLQCDQPCAVMQGHDVNCGLSMHQPGCVCGGALGGEVPEAPASSPTYLDQPITVHFKAAYGALPEFRSDDDSITSILLSADGMDSPGTHVLRQNFPNPFSPRTTIAFRIAARSEVALEIFDLAGRRVRRLVNGFHPAGEWRLEWDGRSDLGERMPAGPYLYRLRVNGQVQARKLTILGE